MVFCSNRLEEIKNFGKVRRINYRASIHGDNKDTCEKEQVWKCVSMKKYVKVWRLKTRCHRRWMDPTRQEKEKGGTLSQYNNARD